MADVTPPVKTIINAELKSQNKSQKAKQGGFKDNLELSERVGGFLEDTWPILLAVLVLTGLGFAGYSIYNHFQMKAEETAQLALFSAEAPFVKAKESFERAKLRAILPAFAPPDQPGEPKATLPTGNLDTDYGGSIAKLEKVVDEFPRSNAGKQAGIDLVWVYLEYKKPGEALRAISKVTADAKPKEVMGALSLVSLGEARAANDQCPGAIAAWKQVLDDTQTSFLHPDLIIKSGLCFEQMKQPDKAIELYKRAAQDFSDTPAGQTAKGYLRALEIKGPADTQASAPVTPGKV